MASSFAHKNGYSVRAHQGDQKTLLAFNAPDSGASNLAGFTIQCRPDGRPAYYLLNFIRFQNPAVHAQVASELPNSTVNAPIQKFRWLHVPGSFHQGTKPFYGPYTYTVTPRFFDAAGSMLPFDPNLSISVTITVEPFRRNGISLGFTRGFTQSQAYVNHYGPKARIQPIRAPLIFPTGDVAGTNPSGQSYTYEEEYAWLGFTARERIFEILQGVVDDPTLQLDMFAYDLNEPDILGILFTLAKQQRIRLLLDNAALHHDPAKPKREDQAEALLNGASNGVAVVKRDNFGRYAHDKVLIVSKKGDGGAKSPVRVLTGSTNFSVTGLYVNSNHVIVFDDVEVAGHSEEVFEAAWNGAAAGTTFAGLSLAKNAFSSTPGTVPPTTITYSPHDALTAKQILDGVEQRINDEASRTDGSVLFAVMELGKGSGPVIKALQSIHANGNVFSYGITDTTSGICLYARGSSTGVLVTGKPAATKLPPPFSQVPGVGLGHQIHHKFIVCGFNGPAPVVYCGSSNLAQMGEQLNGDNLLAIRDPDVATAFAVEAVGLVDHFAFLNRAAPAKPPTALLATPSLSTLAVSAGFFLADSGRWARAFFDPKDLHCKDRLLFA